MALRCLCLVVLRDCSNLQEFIAPISFQIIYLLLGEMPVSWNAKANLLLLICMSSLSRSAPSCQQQLCWRRGWGWPTLRQREEASLLQRTRCGTSTTCSPAPTLSRAVRSPGSCCHLPPGDCFPSSQICRVSPGSWPEDFYRLDPCWDPEVLFWPTRHRASWAAIEELLVGQEGRASK